MDDIKSLSVQCTRCCPDRGCGDCSYCYDDCDFCNNLDCHGQESGKFCENCFMCHKYKHYSENEEIIHV